MLTISHTSQNTLNKAKFQLETRVSHSYVSHVRLPNYLGSGCWSTPTWSSTSPGSPRWRRRLRPWPGRGTLSAVPWCGRTAGCWHGMCPRCHGTLTRCVFSFLLVSFFFVGEFLWVSEFLFVSEFLCVSEFFFFNWVSLKIQDPNIYMRLIL